MIQNTWEVGVVPRVRKFQRVEASRKTFFVCGVTAGTFATVTSIEEGEDVVVAFVPKR
jgi:hypothetical protein